MPKLGKVLLVDFDGVLANKGRGKWASPVAGAISAMSALRKLGYDTKVFTTRALTPAGKEYVESWLEKHGVIHDGVTAEKLAATYYIDDRAIRFDGSWDDTLQDIRGQKASG